MRWANGPSASAAGCKPQPRAWLLENILPPASLQGTLKVSREGGDVLARLLAPDSFQHLPPIDPEAMPSSEQGGV